MNYRIPFILPSFPKPQDIADDVAAIISSNWYTNFGPYEKKLRSGIAEYTGQYIDVCTTSNATAALDIAVKALFGNDSNRKQVIIPAFTFAAGGNVLLMNNLEPVFIDINNDWQPDISQAREYIENNSNRVAGILLCNIFGVGNQQVKEWEELCVANDMPLIIDSAAGFGSEYFNGEKLGARGDCEIFSLHATKPFAVGEGGAITSKNTELISRCRSLTNFGFDAERKVSMLGTNAKLNEISCSIGVRQLVNLENRIKNRRKSYWMYRESLEPMGFEFQQNSDISTVAFVSVLASSAERASSLLAKLTENGVEAKQYYDPLNRQPLFQGYINGPHSLRITNDVADRIICLPLHDNMSEGTIREIVSIIDNTYS